MSRRLLLTFLTLLSAQCSFGNGNYSNWWQKANELYAQKEYDSAELYYNKIAAREPDNAEVYYNLGNAHYKLNNIGLAILNYEKALKLQPAHKLASDNLYLTQSRINNRIQGMPEIFFIRWWHNISQTNLANIYAIFAAVFFVALIAYHMGRRAGRIRFALPVQLTVAVLALCMLMVLLSYVSAKRLTASSYAIVIHEGAQLMTEPKYGKSQSLIPEGTKVEIHNTKATWFAVTLPDGRIGWLQKTALAKI